MPKEIILNTESESVRYLCKKDKRLAKVISMVGPITYKTYDDPYSFLVHEIIEQMLSIKVGAVIYDRLNQLCNGNISPKAITVLADEQIKGIGTSKAKVTYIRALTDAVVSGNIVFSELETMSDSEVVNILTAIRGVGNWTAKMYLIFVLNRQDVLPVEDVAFQQSYSWMHKTNDISKKTIIKKCEKWKPYSSIAARFLYRALDMGFTKKEFHLYK